MSQAPHRTNAKVLFVDDEPGLADLYQAWLADEHDTETAYSGQEALDAIDETVDVVFLDRRMPDLCGDEVLETVRERGYDGYVTMVTGVDPDFDIIEMDFEEYLVKPVSQSELEEIVERALTRSELDEQVQELFALAQKRAALEAEKPIEALENSAEYQELLERMDQLRAQTTGTVADLDHDSFRAVLSGIRESATLADEEPIE